MEPFQLKRWKLDISPNDAAYFYTCARPGRSKGRDKKLVADDIVSAWVCGLPRPDTAIISLLGRKQGPEGLSEFSYYSFWGDFDTPSERGSQPSFQEWLDQQHEHLKILVREHPTYDDRPIPYNTLAAVESDIRDLISEGRMVVVVDSGGVDRTGQAGKHMKATRSL